jgi:hypothetical protein
MRENEPVLLVLSVCDGEIILEKGEILCEKCQFHDLRNELVRKSWAFQPCAILWWQKIVSLQKRVSRNRRHFMVRIWRISSLLKRDK